MRVTEGEGMRRSLSASIASIVVQVLALAMAGMPASAQHPNVDRGMTASGSFDVGGIDVVNGWNGNLSIRIPIGGSYPVGGPMGSYAFSLTYNSNAWSLINNFGEPCGPGSPNVDTLAVADPYAMAGLGWTFSLGRIGNDPTGQVPPPRIGLATYQAADGGKHSFFADFRGGTPSYDSGYWFTNDGTFMRYRDATGPDELNELELPDGTKHTFYANGYPHTILDRFGNGLTITYDYFPERPEIPSKWTITDGFRTHFVVFKLTGLTAPEQEAVVDSIEVASFAGSSTYKFRYNYESDGGGGGEVIRMIGFGQQKRTCPGPNDPPDWNPRVLLLTKLILPDETSYSMPSYRLTPGEQGALTRLNLPTGGAIEWDYGNIALPAPGLEDDWDFFLPAWSASVAVTKRRLYDRINPDHEVGAWTYGTPDNDDIPVRANEIVRQVIHPPLEVGGEGHRVVTYYSACVYVSCPNESGVHDTYAVDYGLPFSRRRQGDGTRFLSQEVYAPGATTPLRQIYVKYENDGGIDPTLPNYPGIYQFNPRLQSQRTVFLDDKPPSAGGAYAAVVTSSDEYDGLGHYRKVTTSDNFGYGTNRIERTAWNKRPDGTVIARPVGAQPWILNSFGFQEQQEGSALVRQELDFDSTTGFLRCKRWRKDGAQRGARDVLVSYVADARGQVVTEKWFGGDGQTLLVDSACAAGTSPGYSFTHAYDKGVRNGTTTTVTLAPGQSAELKLLDLDVNTASGLTGTSRDSAGRPTVFQYDEMGRLKKSSPQGDAEVGVDYHLPQTVPPEIETLVGSTTTPMEKARVALDGLGRPVAQEVSLPAGAASVTMTTYNAMGWKSFVTEPGTGAGTSYRSYDPFGRPAVVRTADLKETLIEYEGIRVVKRTQRVWDGARDALVTSKEEYDGLGRLMRVREPNGTWTRYAYDVGGRLASVVMNPGSGNGQWRNFTYDGRGFLAREVQPESGETSYEYDARGNLIRKATPTATLIFEYDEAGRLRKVSTPQAPLKILTYRPDGKLERAQAFNDRVAAGACTRFEIAQTFGYEPTHGRLSTQETSLLRLGVTLKWKQEYTYDGTGRITQIKYPYCTSGCDVTTPRPRTTIYDKGRPTSVPGFASSITYHSNGLVATIQHQNGVVFTQTTDTKGMARPGSLEAKKAQDVRWPYEGYSYDGSGNIRGIGGKTFAYDPSSRLVFASLPGAGPDDLVPGAPTYTLRRYDYDRFGNLTRVERGYVRVENGKPVNVWATGVAYDANPLTNRLVGASYNGSGNLISHNFVCYKWDALQRLASVAVVGGPCQSSTPSDEWIHVYDASDERVWSWQNRGPREDKFTLRRPDGLVLTELTKAGSPFTWVDYAYREGKLLGTELSTGEVVHLDVDHLGSVRLETKADGSIKSYRDYWPYGDLAATSSPLSSDGEQMKFTGHERDLGNLSSIADDVDYMHARYYRPLFARFLSPDPLNGQQDRPQSWNRYAYGQGMPLTMVDPTGRKLELTNKTQAERDEVFAAIQEYAGPEAAELLYVEKMGGYYYVSYKGRDNDQLAATGEAGVYLADIIDSRVTTEVSMAESFKTRDGTFTTAEMGGAATAGQEESRNGRIQIYLHPDATAMMNARGASPLFAEMRSSDGRRMFYNDGIIFGHELGHAWANLRGDTTVSALSNATAIAVENLVRAAEGLNLRTRH